MGVGAHTHIHIYMHTHAHWYGCTHTRVYTYMCIYPTHSVTLPSEVVLPFLPPSLGKRKLLLKREKRSTSKRGNTLYHPHFLFKSPSKSRLQLELLLLILSSLDNFRAIIFFFLILLYCMSLFFSHFQRTLFFFVIQVRVNLFHLLFLLFYGVSLPLACFFCPKISRVILLQNKICFS